MQTFLPFPNALASAEVLDYRRLGKQRVEAKQILTALTDPDYGWQNHPATRMWRNHPEALCLYGLDICLEWRKRGYRDTCMDWFLDKWHTLGADTRVDLPPWWGDEAFHLSHQSNLIRKDPEYYTPFFPGVPDDLPYVWPEASA